MHLYLNGFTYARTSIVDLYVHLYLSAFIFSMTCIYKRRVQDGSGVPLMLFEQLPNHRHRNLKAFEEHIQKHVLYGFSTESYLYGFYMAFLQSHILASLQSHIYMAFLV